MEKIEVVQRLWLHLLSRGKLPASRRHQNSMQSDEEVNPGPRLPMTSWTLDAQSSSAGPNKNRSCLNKPVMLRPPVQPKIGWR